jgi:hypothetical protein
MCGCACLQGKLCVVYRTTNLHKMVSMDFQHMPREDMRYIKSVDVYISCMFDANKTLVHVEELELSYTFEVYVTIDSCSIVGID